MVLSALLKKESDDKTGWKTQSSDRLRIFNNSLKIVAILNATCTSMAYQGVLMVRQFYRIYISARSGLHISCC